MQHAESIIKYPRTPHLEGSSLQAGDEDLSQAPYSSIAGKFIVVEEKMDGANAGIRFTGDAELRLQSRGHYLTGEGREKHFRLLKSWANAHEEHLFEILSDRYLMYGEWMHSKHTVFYDWLPHYFLEFDLFDTHSKTFLSTGARRELLAGSPVVSVPVLYEGIAPRHQKDLLALIKPSLAKSEAWRETLRTTAIRQGLDASRVIQETEGSDLAEGIYIKVEDGNETVNRLKWVRSGFLQTITENDSHWLSRPVVPNQLAPGIDIFAEKAGTWPAASDGTSTANKG